MNERNLRAGTVCAAAVLLGGGLVIALPQHARSIVQLVIVTVPAAMGLYALASRVPPTGWLSPLKWMSPFAPSGQEAQGSEARDELALIRSRLAGWRQPVAGGPALPPATLTLLKPLIGRALELDPHEAPPPEAARARVSPFTWAALTTEPRSGLRWIIRLPPDRDEVARAVEHVLDDLDRCGSQASASPHPKAP